MNRTVSRKRFDTVAGIHPGLVPAKPDVGTGIHGKADTIIDFVSALSPLASGRVEQLPDTPEFARKHSSALLSAVSGGQWPQVRKAAVPKWGIEDNRSMFASGWNH